MKRNTGWLTIVIGVLLLFSLMWEFSPQASSKGMQQTEDESVFVLDNPGMENYDLRIDESPEAQAALERYREKLGPDQIERVANMRQAMTDAQSQLAQSVPGLEVIFSELVDAPKLVGVDVMFRNFLTSASSEERESIVRGFVNENSSLYGLTGSQVAQLRTTADYTNPAGNLSWVRLEQEINGLSVFQGEMQGALTLERELVRTVGQLAPGLDYAELVTEPAISAADAVVSAAASIGVIIEASDLQLRSVSDDGATYIFEPGPFADDIKVELQYFPLEPGLANLSWSMVLWQDVPAYHIIIDAEIGGLFYRQNITNDQTENVTYSVYNSDSPAPHSPSSARPGSTFQAPGVGRTTFTIISELPAFDDLGWITDGDNITAGNNANARITAAPPPGFDPTGRVIGNPFRVFNFAYNPPPLGTDAPTNANFRAGATTNVFFWTNRYHDRLYQLGFTEQARNFQQNNFGRGGLGNDRVNALVQSVTNNAFFSTPKDGLSGTMQMGIFTGPFPDRDSDLDQEIVIHELTHGTSNRLHNNGGGLNATQSGGMGEGWSDFYGLSLLSEAGDAVNGVYAVGAYSTIQFSFPWFFDNYYYGIRRFPHAVRSSVGPSGRPFNPLTFADIDSMQISLTDGEFPRGPIGSASAQAVHNIGEVWCAALWEVRARLITRLGWAVGNQRMLQIVTDGMKLDPINPTLLQARDSIIEADIAGFGGADVADIWAGFAARGMGFGATVSAATCPGARCAVTESFMTPP